MGIKVLGRVRLSRSTEESTSVERQREMIVQWAQMHDAEIIGWAVDDGVSGSVDPFSTPSLGPWLTDPEKVSRYTTVVAWKLDRLGRSAVLLNKLFAWANENGKTLVSVSESIDLSTWSGRMLASVIAGLAEGELEAIRERQLSSRAKLREVGRWAGGTFPYGYRPVPVEDGPGWRLEVDPGAAEIVRGIVSDVLDDKGIPFIVARLNDAGVLIPAEHRRSVRGKAPDASKRWVQQTVRQILRSPSLLGYSTKAGATIRDDSGDPVMIGQPLVSLAEFERVQKRLEKKLTYDRRETPYPLAGIVVCPGCRRALHHSKTTTRRGSKSYEYTYLVHPVEHRDSCEFGTSTPVPVGEAEALVEDVFLGELGDTPVVERVWVPGDSRDDEIRAAVSALDELQGLIGTMTSETAKQRLRAQIQAKDEELGRLEQAPRVEAHWEYVPVGGTYRDAWSSASAEERRGLLVRSGISVALRIDTSGARRTPTESGVTYAEVYVPEDLRDRFSNTPGYRG
ncbi:recombinase family protein [Gordonia sp. HY285]|uniref:recombinase family protein n=1 Tax=Gordonia liuliyuniae TaxID=2911517 RepID=UPI001F1603B4|nr:recombinase family protein [Gordonia liuliyuniae]MCF8611714.1 recombinase family protein [Gordonia liuliyuniae]